MCNSISCNPAGHSCKYLQHRMFRLAYNVTIHFIYFGHLSFQRGPASCTMVMYLCLLPYRRATPSIFERVGERHAPRAISNLSPLAHCTWPYTVDTVYPHHHGGSIMDYRITAHSLPKPAKCFLNALVFK